APDPVESLSRGKLHFTLHGRKLKGEWALARMRPRDNDDKPQWLILKSGKDRRPYTDREENRSALTGRSMEQISQGSAVWESNRATDNASGGRRARAAVSKPKARKQGERESGSAPALGIELTPLPAKMPGFIEPMKALLSASLPAGADWIYEIKFDGVRALGIKTGKGVQLISRAAKDLSVKYAPVLDALKRLPAKQFTLDGEIVALDAEGRSSFQLLQNYQSAGRHKPPLVYYAFDLLNLDGKSLVGLPLFQRKAALEGLLAGASPSIRFSAGINAKSAELVRAMKARGLEGIVAKRRDSKYEPGRRGGAWIKFKWTNEQEFVIGGYTRPGGTRKYFGSVMVGYYESGKLKFAAKVGTGFDEKLLSSLYGRFRKIISPRCPFSNLPEKPPGVSPGLMRMCTWLEPKLVCQVRFAEWTRDHHLRQPCFLGLREDKQPEEVRREQPAGG
ncbi:MAG TPA: non-homologous end-joining DNA ligase, partial [Verrucomicrobiae bacterium]|nr:non-homologous end-joining DNA ligase [Verrucomicrobiae bacterium]